ncbi:MAG: hypothetical protein ACRCZF_00780, partial [Gemmataceae bacterium]
MGNLFRFCLFTGLFCGLPLITLAQNLLPPPAVLKPSAPSECHIRTRIEVRGTRTIALLQVQYRFRTTLPNQSVNLGGQRAFLAAITPAGTPLVEADGLIVAPETPGDQSLTLDLECPVTSRGGKGETGFEFGLPRAAITTLAIVGPPAGIKKITVSTRAGTDAKRTTDDISRYQPAEGKNGPPLGAMDSVDISWELPSPASAAPATPLTAEAEITARLDDAQLEVQAKLRLRGPPRDWILVLPLMVDVTVERSGSTGNAVGPAASIVRPVDAKSRQWTITTPDNADWVVTVSQRVPRPEPRHAGPYALGPFYVKDVPRQSGSVRLFAPVNLLLAPRTPAEVRRQDLPAGFPADETPAALFRYASAPLKENTPVPLVEFEVKPARGVVLVTPIHRLRLTEAGWRLRAELKIAPIRTEVEQLTIDVPTGWQNLDVLPPELVEEVREAPRGKFMVRLAVPRKEPFELTLEATLPVAVTAREAQIALPRFPGSQERRSQVSVTVPEGFEVRGTARSWDGKMLVDDTTEMAPVGAGVGAGAAVVSLGQSFEIGAGALNIAWQPYRPELFAEVLAEVTPFERQIQVQQTVKLSAAEPLPKLVKWKGPLGLVGLQSTPVLESAGP